MTVSDLLQRVRSRLRDDVGDATSQLWSNYDIIDDAANEARNKMFRIVRRMLIDSTTATDAAGLPLATLAVIAGTASYAMSPKILRTGRIQLSTQTSPLVMKTREELDALNPNWINADAGEPWAYCPDMGTDRIWFYPKPVANATASLTNYILPLVALSEASMTAGLGFREEYQPDLVYGIQEILFQKQDNEVNNLPLSVAYGEKFLERLEAIKRDLLKSTAGAHTNRCHQAFRTK